LTFFKKNTNKNFLKINFINSEEEPTPTTPPTDEPTSPNSSKGFLFFLLFIYLFIYLYISPSNTNFDQGRTMPHLVEVLVELLEEFYCYYLSLEVYIGMLHKKRIKNTVKRFVNL